MDSKWHNDYRSEQLKAFPCGIHRQDSSNSLLARNCGTLNMILFNPTASQVSVTFDGNSFVVGPKDTVSVSDEIGAKWMKVHEFLQEQKAEPKKVKEVKEEEEVVEKKAKK